MKVSRQYINFYLANVSFLLVIFAIAGDLFVEAIPRKAFYSGCYIAIAGLLFFSNWRDIKSWWSSNKHSIIFIAGVFILGLSKIVWSILYHTDSFQDIRNNYHAGGKMLMLSALLALYLLKSVREIHKVSKCVALSLSLILAVLTAWFGYQEQLAGFLRIKLLADAATTTGYILVIQAIICMTLIKTIIDNRRLRAIGLLVAFFMFASILLMTETRGAIGTFFIVSFCLMCHELKAVKRRYWLLSSLILLLAIGAVAYKMHGRILEVMSDVQALQNDNANTSIGARAVMLDAGVEVTTFSLFGQRVDDRYNKAKQFIESHYNSPEAIRSIGYHFHNDIIESLSLQGIFGFLAIIFFYLSGISAALRQKPVANIGLLLLVSSLILMGIPDVIMIQSNTAMVIGASCIVALIVGRNHDYS